MLQFCRLTCEEVLGGDILLKAGGRVTDGREVERDQGRHVANEGEWANYQFDLNLRGSLQRRGYQARTPVKPE